MASIAIMNVSFRDISVSLNGATAFIVRKALCSVSVVGNKVELRWSRGEVFKNYGTYSYLFDYTECTAPTSSSNSDCANKINVFLNNSTAIAADASLLNGQPGSYYLDRANHTGTQLASTISDFAAAVLAAQKTFKKCGLVSGTIDGTNTVFVFDNPPVQVFWNGQKLVQNRVTNGYTLSINTITLTEAPMTGDDVEAYSNY